ncbi:Aldo/keto reductase [Polyporus arcularius HHB13444]|uniref:Aldo/keto reductase n=1 Tax=Polyporus arcularius HHB13444 TaxID=1314778 RepID=A0A5C3P7W5_9APHY|nr:Aldo/keto reductase [Polyporus arcularius HHB13444]
MSIVANKMKYVRLGNSGLKVSKIILGTALWGNPKFLPWATIDEEAATAQVKLAYEHGIQTFDTANIYSMGLAEKYLGNAIRKLNLPREELVIMTKIGLPFISLDDPNAHKKYADPERNGIVNQRGLNRKYIFDAVKAALARMQLEYIDVLQCHRFDPTTPIEETMRALHDVVQAGYVRYIGMSSCWAYQFQAMQNYALKNNLTPFISMQNHYNLLYREEEREMFPTLKMLGVGSTPWSPLAKGLLTRPLSAQATTIRGKGDPSLEKYKSAATQAIVDRVEEFAKKKGVSMAQISLAWLMHKEGVTAPVVGPTSLEKLQDLIGSVDVELNDEEMRSLEEPYVPVPIFGHS